MYLKAYLLCLKSKSLSLFSLLYFHQIRNTTNISIVQTKNEGRRNFGWKNNECFTGKQKTEQNQEAYMYHLQFITYWLSYVPYDCNLLVFGALYSGVNTPRFQRNLLPVSSQMMSNKILYFVSLLFALQTFHFQNTCIHTLISVIVYPHYLSFLWFSDLMEIHYIGRYSVDGIATHYGLDCPGIEYRKRRDIPHLPRLALGSTASCQMNHQ